MAGIYVYSDDVLLVPGLVGFAKANGQDADVVAVGNSAATELSNSGAATVHLLQADCELVEAYARPIAEFLRAQQAELFVVGATARGRELASKVAGYLDCGMVSDVSALSYTSGRLTADRLVYGGAVVQSEKLDAPAVVTVPAGLYQPASGASPTVSVPVEPDLRVSRLEVVPVPRQGTNVAQAQRVVSIGMGLDAKEDLAIVQALADELDAAVGCSRGVAEEREWLGQDQYIGISGLSIKPQLYLALGISGQAQHMVGVREAKVIVAINKDEKAPIFKASDYGIVGDMYEVIPALIKALAK